MRDLNECKAEIFRRSERRIKERKKKRDRILALCIPLCLLVTVWSVIIPPVMLTKTDSKGTDSDGLTGNDISGSYVCSYTEVVIRDTNTDLKKITDSVEVTKIFSAISNLYGDMDGAEPEADADDTETEALPESTPQLNGYVITFRTEDGSETIYTLDGKELLHVDENITIILTDSQIAELKEVLGIAE